MIIGLGVDLVDIARARRMCELYGDRIFARVCTPGETEYITSHADGAQHLAVRLAAKEAGFKALAGSDDARAIGWKEIEVVGTPGGPPRLVFHGRARARAHELGVTNALVSLSHGDAIAIAVVLLQDSPE